MYKHQAQVICNTERKDNAWMTQEEYIDPSWKRVAFLDGSVFPGATGVMELGKQLRPSASKKPGPEHIHQNSGETLFFLGTDCDHKEQLNAEVIVYIEGEKHIITHSCVVYIPAGVAHGPVVFTKVNRPVMYSSCLHDVSGYEWKETGRDPVTAAKAPGETVKYINYSNKRTDPDPEWFKTEAFKVDRWNKAVFTDTEIIEDAAMSDCEWKINATPEGGGHPFHYHPNADEILMFLGSDPEDSGRLTGTIDWYIEGEQVTMPGQGMIYMPKNMEHGPMIFREMNEEMPMQVIQTFTGGEGARKYVSIPPT